MPKTIYYKSTTKVMFLGLLSLAFTIVGFYLSFSADISFYTRILLYLASVFFLIGTVYFTVQMVKSKEYIILTEDGFYDNTSAIATKDLLIEWNQVDYIDLYEMNNNQFIGVHLLNPEYIEENRSSFKSMAASANKKLGYGDVVMSTNALKDASAADVLEKMTQYLNFAKQENPQDR